jgi:predicted transcriptional regulator
MDIRKFRAEFNLSQYEVGLMFGITPKAVSNIETGFRKPSRTISKVVGLLGSLPKVQARSLVRKLISQDASGVEGNETLR